MTELSREWVRAATKIVREFQEWSDRYRKGFKAIFGGHGYTAPHKRKLFTCGASTLAREPTIVPHANDSSRDLLFGVFALQNGLIDQGQLLAAFQSWTHDKSRSMADHLISRGDLDAGRSGCRGVSRLRGTSRSMATTSRKAWRRSMPAARLVRAWPACAMPTSRPLLRMYRYRSHPRA